MTTTLTRLTVAGLAGLVLAGCAVRATPPTVIPPPTAAPTEAAEPAPEPEPTTTGPAGAPAPTVAASDGGGEPPASDGGGEQEQPGLPTVPSAGDLVQVALAPASPTAVMYLRAEQAFSPELERWVVDGAELHYTRYSCTGQVQHEVYGELTDDGSGVTTVSWEGDSPESGWGSSSTESYLVVTDRTLTPLDGDSTTIASTRTELELEDYTRICTDAGKDLAGFML